MSEATQAKAAESSARASQVRVFGLIAELGDAANHDRIHAQQLADFRGGIRVSAVAVGKVLLRHDLVQRLPLDYRVAAVLDQVSYQQVRDPLAYIDILSEERGTAAMHRGI